jgi:hypothetical protein
LSATTRSAGRSVLTDQASSFGVRDRQVTAPAGSAPSSSIGGAAGSTTSRTGSNASDSIYATASSSVFTVAAPTSLARGRPAESASNVW